MDTNEYIQNALKTDGDYAHYEAVSKRFTPYMARILHATIGLSTEAGELLDALKKSLYYGKELDEVNLKEETGDLFWYLAILADSLDIDFEFIMSSNIEKLKARYGDKFTSERALQRDLLKEREVLEGTL